MFYLIFSIAIIAVEFSLLLHLYDNTLYSKNCLNKPVIISIIFNAIIFYVIFFYPNKIIFLFFGIVIILRGFIYLGIFNLKVLHNIDHLTSLSFVITIITASSGLKLESALFNLVIFYFIFFITSPILNSSKIKSSEYFTVLLELNHVLTGIFMFIIGLVMSVDRIEILEKITNNLF